MSSESKLVSDNLLSNNKDSYPVLVSFAVNLISILVTLFFVDFSIFANEFSSIRPFNIIETIIFMIFDLSLMIYLFKTIIDYNRLSYSIHLREENKLVIAKMKGNKLIQEIKIKLENIQKIEYHIEFAATSILSVENNESEKQFIKTSRIKLNEIIEILKTKFNLEVIQMKL